MFETDAADTFAELAVKTIYICWHPGEDFTAETTGTWLDFEIESALDEARLMLLSEEDDDDSD